MLTILHGDNIAASRDELVKLKERAKDKEIRDINGKDIIESELRQAVESLSLFGNSICIVIENIFSSLGRKETLTKLYGTILKEASTTVDIILWESKELGKTALQSVPGAQIHLFKTPAIIFDFLDGLMPNNIDRLLPLFEKTVESVPAELIGYMLGVRIRQLIQVKDGIVPEKTSPWQRMRLTNQAKSFTMEKLLIMHKQIREIEFSVKTGSSPFTFAQLIKKFIIEL
jgi:DNA polymerase III delta subunit